MKKEGAKKLWEKFWFLIWKDDSFKGWLFSVIFLVAFILLVFFPLLRFATGTMLPLAIVESCSMHHENNIFTNFDSWWEEHDSKYAGFIVNKLDFEKFILKNGFSKGDILFIIKANPEKIKEGDIIIFESNKYQNPLIHRVVEINEKEGEKIFSTIGDNNNGQLGIEKEIYSEQIVGKAVLRIVPYVGWIKLIFFEHLRPVQERGFCSEN